MDPSPADDARVAVCAMAARFPGASDIDRFWSNLANGVESITRFTNEELLSAGEDPALLQNPDYVKARAILDDVELFDAAFFGFSPKEAEILDPQVRLLLECAWEALEQAGYDTRRYKGVVGLFAGASFSNYLVHNLYTNRAVMDSFGDFQTTIYNVPDALATLIGYKLNLKGACCAVSTFCSTSLVCLHLACQALLNYEIDMALAGGSTVYVPQTSGYLYEKGGIVSPDGTCRAFDAHAQGTVFGNGVGAVLLKRLEDALRDGDPVHAVILGSAVNNDGSHKVSYAAPGVVGQTEVIVEALAASGVDPETIGFVETHGTGTLLGDPAEIRALTQAFRTKTEEKGFCAIGSVKSNVGHLDAAAGVAGLIKVILSLKHGQIPPSLHFGSPNPQIDFESSPFYVNTKLNEWTKGDGPRRGAVSAFGIGGTNAHVIVEEAPAVEEGSASRSHQLLLLSARTAGALDEASGRLAAHLEAHPEVNLADVAYTLQVGRREHAHRRFFVCADRDEAVARLRKKDASNGSTDRVGPPVVFLFPGDVSYGSEVARQLCEKEKIFREAFEGCARISESEPVALFALEYALARLWNQWGVRAESMIGEGVGEYVAACMAEKLSLEDGLALAAGREVSVELEAAETLRDDPERVFLVMGPGDAGDVGDRTAIESISRLPGDPVSHLLDALGQLWLAGVEPDWSGFYAGERRRRVPLPTYPFERKRFWVDPLEEEAAPLTGPQGKLADPAHWLNMLTWIRSTPPKPNRGEASRYLLFIDSNGIGTAVAERLREEGLETITVASGDAFGGNPEKGYTLNPLRRDDYEGLFEDLRKRGKLPNEVVHLTGIDRVDTAEARGQKNFYSLLYLGQALGGAHDSAPIQLWVVTSEVYDVVGDETLCPEKATLLGLCRVIPQEHHALRCTSLDVEPHDSRTAERIAAEIRSDYVEPVVSYRRGKRWAQSFRPLSPDQWKGAEPRIRDKGVYFITGGLGNVGWALAAYLAKQTQARLILSGRSTLPGRGEWNAWLEGHDDSDPTLVRIKKVKFLESLGAEVLVVSADVCDPEKMGTAFDQALSTFGDVHGVIHAAGVVAAQTSLPVRELTPDICERQFGPKVYGLEVLDRVLGKRRLDFVLLTSSLSSVLGGLGYGAYASANLFMDAYAARKNREGTTPWISVNWDQWRFVERSDSAELSMSPEEGLATFDAILRLPEPGQVVVSTGSLGERLRRWVLMDRGKPDEPPGRSGVEAKHKRPALGTELVAPRNEVETTVANVWRELLGIDKVGVHDNFFELGGHSLFAARVLSRLKDTFGVALPLESIFDKPTVAELAEQIQALLWAQRGEGPRDDGSSERVEIEL